MGKTPQCKHDTQIKVIKQPIPNANDAEDKLIRCAACGFSGDDPVREVIHSADGPSAVIATTLFEQLPDENRKVLAFSDVVRTPLLGIGDTERSFRPRAALYRLIAKRRSRRPGRAITGDFSTGTESAGGYRKGWLLNTPISKLDDPLDGEVYQEVPH